MPVIGFLSSASPGPFAPFLAAFLSGLRDAGYFEGNNIAIEYRWAEGQYDRLPAMAADLVQRRVAVIVASGANLPVVAAKAVTSTIPIVFTGPDEPVKNGLVDSLSRPGGNVTGAALFTSELESKQIEVLRTLVPGATTIAVLLNPNNPNFPNQVAGLDEVQSSSGTHLIPTKVVLPPRLIGPLLGWQGNMLVHYWSVPTHISFRYANSWRFSPHATSFLHCTHFVILSRPAA
jgi:putative ABC transport system substrate-binding protein